MTYLVTGSTGLVGSALVRAVASRGGLAVAAARNIEKAKRMFDGISNVRIVGWDVTRPLDAATIGTLPPVDGIIHAAAETASRNMAEKPAETIAVTLDGTRNALELARTLKVRGMVYLSSMEIYGSPQEDVLIDETFQGPLDILAPRSSYPLSKRMAEGMCAAYAREYGVNVKIARLAQTVGAKPIEGDTRMVAQFARALARGEDLVLHTDGKSARCYCALSDAVEALLLLVEKGAAGEAYNVCDGASYCSIRELAEKLCRAHPPSKVRIEIDEGAPYAPSCKLRLSAAKLEALGWRARMGLVEAFDGLIGSWREG